MKRTLITLGLVALAILLAVMMANQGNDRRPADRPQAPAVQPDPSAQPARSAPAAGSTHPAPAGPASDRPTDQPAAQAGESATTEPDPAHQPPSADQPPSATSSPTPKTDLPDPGPLVVVEGPARQGENADPVLGSDRKNNPEGFKQKVVLTVWGAGLMHLQLADYSTDVHQHIPYPIQTRPTRQVNDTRQALYYPLAVRSVTVNGRTVSLMNRRWTVEQEAPDRLVMSIRIDRAQDRRPLLKITRTFRLAPGRYDLHIDQQLDNLSDGPLSVVFDQLAQGDLPSNGGYMGDRRTVLLGHFKKNYDKSRTRVYLDKDYQLTRKKVVSEAKYRTLWPNDTSREENYELVFAAMSNRYFTVAVHRPTLPGRLPDGTTRPLAQALDDWMAQLRAVTVPADSGQDDNKHLALAVVSRPCRLAPGGSTRLDLSLYAGPKETDVLTKDPAYLALGLDKTIIYNLGSCCSVLTFQGLARLLLAFLKLIHAVLFDWGLAIIVLVLLVRLILHPLTKKSQLNMMKVGKQMAALKPEMERLKSKYKDNQQKLNQEMMKLYRERGVNPAAMGLGCLPMFLQMPIWIALYAMLYFAIELRHQPAFYGLFQLFGDWSFMADLSSPDHFILLGDAAFTIPLLGWHVDAVNLLPILMGLVFWVQQKYTTQPTAETSDQQAQQQKIMKVMMVVLFPLMLYKAPCGLTLYILASTFAGVIDSKIVRKHLQELEDSGKLFEKKQPKPGGLLDRLQKAAEARQRALQNPSDRARRSSGKRRR